MNRYKSMNKSELKKINEYIKKIPTDKRAVVRRMISADISFNDALTVIKAFSGLTPINDTISPVKASNNPVGATEEGKRKEDTPKTINDDTGKLERVKDTPFDIEEIKQKIQVLIDTFCDIYDIQDLTKEPQRRFTALSSYIGENLFKGTKILKDSTLIDNGSVKRTTCDRYDWDRVAEAVRLYVNLCYLYNKAFLYDGIAAFLHMSENTLKDNNDKLTQRGIDIFKNQENSLASYITDSRTNVTGALACLNHWHGWSGTGSHTVERKETIVLYPALGDITTNAAQLPNKN